MIRFFWGVFVALFYIQPETSAQSMYPTISPSIAQGWAYYSSYQQPACTGNVYAVAAVPLNTCIPQYNLTSIIYFYKYSCDSSTVTTSYYSNSACDLVAANLPSNVVLSQGCAYNKFNMTTSLQCTTNTQYTSLIPSTGYYWAINTTYASPYALNAPQSCSTLSQIAIVMQSVCYVNTGLGSTSGVKSLKITYSSSVSQFIISTYSNYGCSSSNPGTTTLYTYCAPYAIGNNYYAKEIWTFTATVAPTRSPTTVIPTRIPTFTANPSSVKPSALPTSYKPTLVPSSASPTFATTGYAYFNVYKTKNNCSNYNSIVGITAYPLLTCIPVYNTSSSIPIYYARYSCDYKLANTTLYSDALCTQFIRLAVSQTVGACIYKSMNLTASLQCTNSSYLGDIIPFITGVTWNINWTYANSYTAPTQYCSFNLLKVVQVYQNNYCFPSSIEGSAYKSFLTSGSSTLVNSYSAGGCTGTKTSVTVYNTCRRYQTSTSSGLYIAQYWSFLYSNSPPTFKPTSKPSTGKPTQKPITRIPTFAPSTRRPSSALTGYAYFNSYSGSKCTGKVAAITAYPIGICIPQYNTTTIVRYVYYNCDKTAIIASYFKDSSCVINSTLPIYYPIANNSCIYSALNLTAAAFCNSSVSQYTKLIPKTLGDSWNINVSYAAPLSYSGSQYCFVVNMIQIYLNTFCYNYAYNGKKSFLTNSKGYLSGYSNPQCGSGSFSSINIYTTCQAYKTNGGTYVQNMWTLGFTYYLPTSSPTRIPTISFAPTYAPSTVKPSAAPSVRPTVSPTTTLLGYAYFYSYTIAGCTGSIVAVTAYPLGSCIPQYNATSITNYIKYSCNSRFANATKYVDSGCTIISSSSRSLTSYPLLQCIYSVLNYSSNAQCSSSPSYLDIVPAIPGSVWMINVSYAAPFNYNPSGTNMMCGTINIVQMYQNSWCFAYSQNGYKSFKVLSSQFSKYTQNTLCTGSFSSTSLSTACTDYSVPSVGYVTNTWILNYALTKPPTFLPTVSPPTIKPTTATPSYKPTQTPSKIFPSLMPSSITPTTPSAIPTTSQPSTSMAPTNISTTAPSKQPVSPSFGPSLTLSTAPTASSTVTSNYPTCVSTLMPSTTLSSEPLLCSPTLVPTVTPSSTVPSLTPTLIPNIVPSIKPAEPFYSPTGGPMNPSAAPSVESSSIPSSTLSGSPIITPSGSPTLVPTDTPSSTGPSPTPTLTPSDIPSIKSTGPPTESPTKPSTAPSIESSSTPSIAPSGSPTNTPSGFPTLEPTDAPSSTGPSQTPTVAPSVIPSIQPSGPSFTPTFIPTSPTFSPSSTPSVLPSFESTIIPSSLEPSSSPSYIPRESPTIVPTGSSCTPTYLPTTPTAMPTSPPTSTTPTNHDTDIPSLEQAPSVRPSNLQTVEPTFLTTFSAKPSTPSRVPTTTPTNVPSFASTYFPSSESAANVSFTSEQIINGLTASAYYSSQANYSLTLKSTIASCMTGVSPENVDILNVTSSSRRRLSFSLESTTTAVSSISALYVVALASQYSLGDLQSQLLASTSNGFFNKQLTSNAEKFGANEFVNATSSGIIILTVAPTVAPSKPPSLSNSNNNNNNLSAGAIAGISITSVIIFVTGILFAVYYFYYGKAIALPNMPSMPSNRFWSRRKSFDPFNTTDGTAKESYGTKDAAVTFNNPISAHRSNPKSDFDNAAHPGDQERAQDHGGKKQLNIFL